ncbi:MAG TPA: DUF58 domain-containing protein [Solirubrobacteraceae bacterium]|nr:DUF58 domain-containing protein [Solirubrobacteraceae bacterium]
MPRGLMDALDVRIGRLISRRLPGDRRAAGVGAGLELAQLRPYVPGDDVRFLDPAATARTGHPHVRTHVPERALISWILLDVSPSMAFGTALRLKADVAEGVALALGQLGVRRAGSVATLAFGAGEPRLLAPRSARPAVAGLRRLLDDGVAGDGTHDPSALAHALTRVGRLASQPGLIAVISDFREQEDWERPLGALALHHSVLAVEVSDPREHELPAVGRVVLVDPETGEDTELDTGDRRVRKRFAALERERRERVAAELRRLRVEHLTVSTDGPWLTELGRQLR